MNAQPRTAIVTGASRGIGAAVAARLAKDGFALVVNYAGDAAAALEGVHAIEAAGGAARAVRADVADPAAVRRLFDETEAAFGGIDVVVNNAGIMELATLAQTADDSFDRMVSINLKGVFNGMREAAPRIRAGGRIISLSSSVVGLYRPTYGVYGATKAGVEALTHVFANEMRGRSVTVNAVAPGPTATGMLDDGRPPNVLETLARMSPLERLGQPMDIAGAVSFLAGPDGGWVNGQILRVNGGII